MVAEREDDTLTDEQYVTDRLARRFYLQYCVTSRQRPWRKNSTPRWARDYAQLAVATLGFDDEAMVALHPDRDPRVEVGEL